MQEKIEERHKKIAHIQNTIWEIYKTFLNNHDITEYEHKWAELLKTYQNINDEEVFFILQMPICIMGAASEEFCKDIQEIGKERGGWKKTE